MFDFISRATPTGGQDASFLGQILSSDGPGGQGIVDAVSRGAGGPGSR